MPIKMDKPIKVRMHKTIELQPYHLRALKHYYGISTRPNVKRWLEENGYNGLEDLPEWSEHQWDRWEKGIY